MSGVNKVIVLGFLGQKPEVKYTQGGNAICNMSVAVNESWVDKDGRKQEKVEWIRIVAFNKLGENCGKYLDKGKQVYVEGKMQTRKWTDKKSGEDRWMTEVVAQTVQFLGGGNGKRDEDRSERGSSRSSGGGSDEWGPPPSDDDIPFASSDIHAESPNRRWLRPF